MPITEFLGVLVCGPERIVIMLGGSNGARSLFSAQIMVVSYGGPQLASRFGFVSRRLT